MPLLSSHLRREAVPDWLSRLTLPATADLADTPCPLSDVLNGSVYYPAAGHHGALVKWLGGAAHSFVFADYGTRLADARARAERGFSGYRLVGIAEVPATQLTPRGWRPSSTAWRDPRDRTRFEEVAGMGLIEKPFALWSVFERTAGLSDEHGPQRFSLLYIGGDGVATYDALYRTNRIAPRFLCLIRPSTRSGGNYTDFYDEHDLLAQVVLGDASARPRYLLTDGAAADGKSHWPAHYPNSIPTQAYRLWEGD